MKFIDENDIEQINQFLDFDTNECHINGGCDLFTTKPVGSDRKLYKTIDKHFDYLINQQELEKENNNHEIIPGDNGNTNHNGNTFWEQKRRFSSSDVHPHTQSTSPKSLESTPFGPLNETASRRTFAYLIGILNQTYPDYDFSNLNPINFKKLNSINSLKSKFENTLISLGKSSESWIFDIINSHMDLNDCIIYELNLGDNDSTDINSNQSFLDDEPGHLWTFKWFIFNKKRKRVAYLYLNGFRITSPKLNPNLSLNKRRLTIDHDDEEMEEYDLTCSDDENYQNYDYDGFDDAIESDDGLNVQGVVGDIELET
ncbi:Repressor of RNA polymerase III transcription [Wickerhamomyces ciferrii]|uniref:Repressor of RNA polymerase III transcription MAF1 n=1 Tax=Wickerhamomyces ciferrii (strain ATCC 14091 / BCRC 22168 / CBS 111 / JCM 3599 / NBRC 0793 / NRRL Y-1031 F-60-10) TaxID=1206466 RepID=K0KVG7_WICCF|nr:Repressor of RNA polymerase III transcription [Wickerhamomyces ciferrii]CCH45449.1 Repressor of RNA polymerase III transcription [Wickerhamomyces ciferrii]